MTRRFRSTLGVVVVTILVCSAPALGVVAVPSASPSAAVDRGGVGGGALATDDDSPGASSPPAPSDTTTAPTAPTAIDATNATDGTDGTTATTAIDATDATDATNATDATDATNATDPTARDVNASAVLADVETRRSPAGVGEVTPPARAPGVATAAVGEADVTFDRFESTGTNVTRTVDPLRDVLDTLRRFGVPIPDLLTVEAATTIDRESPNRATFDAVAALDGWDVPDLPLIGSIDVGAGVAGAGGSVRFVPAEGETFDAPADGEATVRIHQRVEGDALLARGAPDATANSVVRATVGTTHLRVYDRTAGRYVNVTYVDPDDATAYDRVRPRPEVFVGESLLTIATAVLEEYLGVGAEALLEFADLEVPDGDGTESFVADRPVTARFDVVEGHRYAVSHNVTAVALAVGLNTDARATVDATVELDRVTVDLPGTTPDPDPVGPTVRVGDGGTITARPSDGTVTVPVTIDRVPPEGILAMDGINVTVSNASVARIDPGGVATLNATSDFDAGQVGVADSGPTFVNLSVGDLGASRVDPGDTDVRVAAITLTDLANGTATVDVRVARGLSDARVARGPSYFAADDATLAVGVAPTPFPDGVPGVGATPPRDADPTRPGYEDVDGDGNADFFDVVDLLFALPELDGATLTDADRAAVDFDGDGRVDILDVIELLFRL